MYHISRNGFLYIIIGVFLGPLSGQAATICVGDAASLKVALDASQNNNENNEIRIQSGQYALSYTLAPTNSHSLAIIGGFSPGCAASKMDPSLTEWDPDGTTAEAGSVLNIFAQGDLHIANLRLHGFRGAEYTSSILAALEGPGNILLENLIIDANKNSSEVLFVFNQGTLTLRNILAHDNTAPATIRIFGGTDMANKPIAHDGIALVGLTVVANAGTGIIIEPTGDTVAPLLADTIAFGNTVADVVLQSPPITAYANDIGLVSPTSNAFTLASHDNNAFAPKLDAQFVPVLGSPEIDTGVIVPGLTPAVDIRGCARIYGATLDRGAFEFAACDKIFGDGFE